MEFNGKTAVITGSASGIGKAIASKCSKLGMNLVLADINEKDLKLVSKDLITETNKVINIKTDVSKQDDIKKLVDITYSKFGSCDFLCNNAGIGEHKLAWESTIEEWELIMGINLWSVIYAVKEFVPRMMQQDTESYIINTASLAGISSSNLGSYSVTKHAVVALSETLGQSLQLLKSKIKVAVLCPGMVNTPLMKRELEKTTGNTSISSDPKNKSLSDIIRRRMEKTLELYGIHPEDVAEILFKDLEQNKFYILTHKEDAQMNLIKARMNSILAGTYPENL